MKITLEIAGIKHRFNISLPDGWTVENLLDLMDLHRMSTFTEVHNRVKTEDYKVKNGDVLKVYPVRAAVSLKVLKLMRTLESNDASSRQLTTPSTPQTGLCSLCKVDEAIIWYKYVIGGSAYGYKLCKQCFIRSVEKRVFQGINWYDMIQKNDVVLASISGEKDSAMTLYLLKEYQKNHKHFRLCALCVDCGLGEYDRTRMERAVELCDLLGIDYEVVSLKEIYGLGTRDVFSRTKERKMALTNSICDICVAMRSKVVYDAANRLNCNKIAEGRNSEERTASLLVASVYGSPQMRVVAREPIVPGGYYNIQRIRILGTLSPKEIGLYLHFKRIPVLFHHELQCDFYEYRASGVSKCADIIEEMFPGFVSSITIALGDDDTVFEDMVKKKRVCRSCGVEFFSLTSKQFCNFCRITKELKLETLSPDF